MKQNELKLQQKKNIERRLEAERLQLNSQMDRDIEMKLFQKQL